MAIRQTVKYKRESVTRNRHILTLDWAQVKQEQGAQYFTAAPARRHVCFKYPPSDPESAVISWSRNQE